MTKKRRLRRFTSFVPDQTVCRSLISLPMDVFYVLQAVSINEFLKPAEGENYYRGGGRGGGRGRGRGGRDRGVVSGGGFDGYRSEAAPAIGDTAQFPSLGGK